MKSVRPVIRSTNVVREEEMEVKLPGIEEGRRYESAKRYQTESGKYGNYHANYSKEKEK